MPVLNISQSLRAIGQDLEAHGVMNFEIKTSGDEYVVQCDSDTLPPTSLLTLRYPAETIERLDRLGRHKRSAVSKNADFGAISNVLRAIGAYVANRRGRLLRISNYESPGSETLFKIEFETRQWEHAVEQRSGAALYDLCVNMYKQRRKPPGFAKPFSG